MRSFRLDPYLWVHLVGLAAVPIWLDICLLGLATGEPVLPTWVELAFILAVGIVPVLWMQLTRPFCIFSLLFLALRPDRLSEEQLRLLRLFKDPLVRVISSVVPLPLVWGLWKIYTLAPLASDLSPFTAGGRGLGLLVAAIAFLFANLFTQVPASVLRALITPERVLAKVPPYLPDQVKQNFTVIGLRVNRILPNWSTASETAPQAQAKTADGGRSEIPAGPNLEQELDDWETAAEAAEPSVASVAGNTLDVAELASADAPAAEVEAVSAETVEAEADVAESSVADQAEPDFAVLAADAAPTDSPEPEATSLESASEGRNVAASDHEADGVDDSLLPTAEAVSPAPETDPLNEALPEAESAAFLSTSEHRNTAWERSDGTRVENHSNGEAWGDPEGNGGAAVDVANTDSSPVEERTVEEAVSDDPVAAESSDAVSLELDSASSDLPDPSASVEYPDTSEQSVQL